MAIIAIVKNKVCFLEFYEDSCKEVFNMFKKTWNNTRITRDDKKAQSLLNSIFIKNNKINLFLKGTSFQLSVWKAVLNIERGKIVTYSDIAKAIKKPKAVKAVSNAIGSNCIGFLIPCHRVVLKSAALGGYKWGISRKRIIIAYENMGLFKNPCQTGKIRNIKGYGNEDRNRCRTIC